MPATTSRWKHLLLPIALLLYGCASAVAMAQQISSQGFMGRWDLTVDDAQGKYPSWIEVHPQGASVRVTFVGRIGSAETLKEASISQGVLAFSVPSDNAAHQPQRYQATLSDGMLAGKLVREGQPEVHWTGIRAPALQRSSDVRWGAPQSLISGSGFAGWHFSGPQHGNWSAKGGTLESSGRGADLIGDRSFGDLQLHVEWRCSAKANSGVYLRGRYEVQIETDSASEPPSHHVGGVYGFLAPNPEQPRAPGVWQSFDIELLGRKITVRQNGIVVLDGAEIPGITGGALDSNEAEPGPLVLQGSEDGTVAFRNITVRVPEGKGSLRR